jgi:SOS-response transcriptional repressor LexA
MDLKTADIDSNEEYAQNLAVNLRSLLRLKNITITQLSNALDIPMMTIRRLLSGETTDPRISTLKLVADYFNVSVDSLMQPNSQTSLKSHSSLKPQFVPILDWDTAEKIKNINELELNTWKNWQSVNIAPQISIGINAFALESRPSMYPRFPQGTLFIIDPEVTPKDGDIVLIKIKNNHELTLRELRIDPPEWILQPLVSGSNIIAFQAKHHQIVGVNILTIMYSRNVTVE